MTDQEIVIKQREYYRELLGDSCKEITRLEQELSDSTNHYNKIINDLRAELEQVKRESVKAVTVSFPGMPRSGGGGGGGACGNDHLSDATKMIRPEPSRLEIAAMLLAGISAASAKVALDQADALIAAAKEVTK